MSQKTHNLLTWGMVTIFLCGALLVWGGSVSWKIDSLSIYQWFPLFGLVAWLTMTTHYYTGTIRLLKPELQPPQHYKKVTEYLVLTSLLLHPGLLAFEQFKNDQGLPPGSYVNYAGEGMKWVVYIGSLSLLIFLSYEFFDRMRHNKTVQKYWKVISISQSLAMTLIWVHGQRLGSDLGDGWFRVLWLVLGIALIPCFYIIHRQDFEG